MQVKQLCSQAGAFLAKHKMLIAFCLFLLALSFAPVFINQKIFCYGFEHDEGLFLLAAKEISQGKALYLDILDNKLPALYLSLVPVVAMCGNDTVCTRYFGFGANFLMAIILFAASCKFIKGNSRFVPPTIYLLFSYFSQNFFLRSELLISLALAACFFFLALFLESRKGWHLAAAGALLGYVFFIKPSAPLGMALPIIAIIRWEKGRPKALAPLLAGFLLAAIPLALYFVFFTNPAGFFSQAGEWGISQFFDPSQLVRLFVVPNTIYFYLSVLLLFVVPSLPAFQTKEFSKQEKLAVLFFASVVALVLTKTFALSFHAGLFVMFFAPFSLLVGIGVKKTIQGFGSHKIALAFALAVIASLLVLPLYVFYQSTPSDEFIYFSTSHLECGMYSQVYSYAAVHLGSSLFVFPSRAGYYLVLNRTQMTPLVFHNEVFGQPPKTDQWFEQNVFAPLRQKMPQTVLFFDQSFDERSALDQNLKYLQFKQFLAANYQGKNFTAGNSSVLVYTLGR